MRRLSSRPSLNLGLLLALFAITGCGDGGPATTKVSGKISYKGKPVTSGDLNLYGKANGTGAVAKITAEGTYAFSDALPAGTYAVFITPAPPEPVAPGKAATPKATALVPTKYTTQASTFTLEVKAGIKDYPIDLPE
jgi:hypothetical protein